MREEWIVIDEAMITRAVQSVMREHMMTLTGRLDASADAFRRHPQVEWRAGEVKKAAILPKLRPVPANERERQQHYGGAYAMCKIIFAGVNNSAFAQLRERDG